MLDGKVSGLGLDNDPTKGGFATNLPLAGATVEVLCRSNTGDAAQSAPLHCAQTSTPTAAGVRS